jgi:hypothetical protein
MSTSVPPVNTAFAPPTTQLPPSGSDVQAFESFFEVSGSSAPQDARTDAAGTKRCDDTAVDKTRERQNDTPSQQRKADDASAEKSTDKGDDASAKQRSTGSREDDALPALVSAQTLMPPWLAPQIATLVAPTPSPQAPSGWAQISAYVERLLVESGPRGSTGQPAAMFTLSGDLFADTAVTLKRTDTGWLLRIQTNDPQLVADAKRHEVNLRRRFAERGLGELAVEQVPA